MTLTKAVSGLLLSKTKRILPPIPHPGQLAGNFGSLTTRETTTWEAQVQTLTFLSIWSFHILLPPVEVVSKHFSAHKSFNAQWCSTCWHTSRAPGPALCSGCPDTRVLLKPFECLLFQHPSVCHRSYCVMMFLSLPSANEWLWSHKCIKFFPSLKKKKKKNLQRN